MMKRRRRQHGFTLLELILAAAMTTVLGLTLYASMSIGYRARGTAEAQVQAVREASLAMEIIERDLQSVPPPRGILAGPLIGYAMGTPGAEADRLTFHTLGRDITPGHDPLSDGIRRVELMLIGGRDESALVRRVHRNLLASTQPNPAEEVISRNVRAFALRYFDGFGWVQEWDSTQREDTLPLAVEVSITFDTPSPSDQERWYRVRHVVPLATARAPDPEELELMGADID